MNQHLQHIQEFIENSDHLSEDDKTALLKSLKSADKDLTISEFKLERTNKVKRTTAILLEETIEELEQKRAVIEDSNKALSKSLEDLKAAQAQLVQAEKMASLGELTAGIAHEIQNPLNFVNNFSEVSKELLEEMLEELQNGDMEEVDAIAKDVIQNLDKILHHGQRADGIVKGMLQHSRTNSGEKERTDINQLTDEYLRLAYHGLRAKDKSFNVALETHFDDSINPLKIVPQDIGRVVLNLITNAFHACNDKKKSTPEVDYSPKVVVSTKNSDLGVEISVTDNGGGIPKQVLDKIFQPFFTTKPTGQGTGLGLSLSYDIIKAHGGEIKVTTKEKEGLPTGQAGTEFVIVLPITTKT
ncbi:sensor histidine kinase [Winogradskyella sp. A3E31]|uniref:sensor histidine kinase n=1 Tax=Winogradskyella sp. A3E31 TaxID=3349637 RepID=UPI00398A527B